MEALSERDVQICEGIVRQINRHATTEETCAAGYRKDGYDDTADFVTAIAARWRQLAAYAHRVFADCDRLDAAASAVKTDPETEACRAQ